MPRARCGQTGLRKHYKGRLQGNVHRATCVFALARYSEAPKMWVQATYNM